MATFIQSLRLRGFLSFGPESQAVSLAGLNVLIGPNGVGKSNFIEAIELLHAAPKDFSAAIRIGGLPSNWIWHGRDGAASARQDSNTTPKPPKTNTIQKPPAQNPALCHQTPTYRPSLIAGPNCHRRSAARSSSSHSPAAWPWQASEKKFRET